MCKCFLLLNSVWAPSVYQRKTACISVIYSTWGKKLKSYLFIECLLRVQHKGKLFLTTILTTDAGDSSCDHSNFVGEDPRVLEQEDLPLHLDIGSAMLGMLPEFAL